MALPDIHKIVEEAVRGVMNRELESVKKGIEDIKKDIEDIKNEVGSVKNEIGDIKKWIEKFGPSEVLETGIKYVHVVAPDHCSVYFGPVSVSFHGFHVLETDMNKLIEGIKGGDVQAMKPFISAATSVDIKLDSTVTKMGISWGYTNPAERTGEIVELIKELMASLQTAS